MKSPFISIILLILLVQVSFAQNQELPRKIDEFGEINSEDLSVRLERFIQETVSDPSTKGYLIFYGSKKSLLGFPYRESARFRSYFRFYLGENHTAIEVIYGGIKEQEHIELWIGSDKNKPPLTESVEDKIEIKSAILFDKLGYISPDEGGSCCIIDEFDEAENIALYTQFIKLLNENNNLQGYLIYYGRYCKTCNSSAILLDSAKTNARILRKEKNNLVKNYKINTSRIVAVNGGYRDWRVFELWLVPKGEKPPKPMPTMFPRKRVQKKNK